MILRRYLRVLVLVYRPLDRPPHDLVIFSIFLPSFFEIRDRTREIKYYYSRASVEERRRRYFVLILLALPRRRRRKKSVLYWIV